MCSHETYTDIHENAPETYKSERKIKALHKTCKSEKIRLNLNVQANRHCCTVKKKQNSHWQMKFQTCYRVFAAVRVRLNGSRQVMT